MVIDVADSPPLVGVSVSNHHLGAGAPIPAVETANHIHLLRENHVGQSVVKEDVGKFDDVGVDNRFVAHVRQFGAQAHISLYGFGGNCRFVDNAVSSVKGDSEFVSVDVHFAQTVCAGELHGVCEVA